MTTTTPDYGPITALVTGANRGLGKRFAADLVARGAEVYAAARRPETVDIPGVAPIALDITDPESVRRAAQIASDVNIVVNNAGVSTQSTCWRVRWTTSDWRWKPITSARCR